MAKWVVRGQDMIVNQANRHQSKLITSVSITKLEGNKRITEINCYDIYMSEDDHMCSRITVFTFHNKNNRCFLMTTSCICIVSVG